MASNWSLCGVCDNRQRTKSSVVWCSECDEGLCEDCKEHHRIFKETKNHETVSIVDYKKLHTEVLQTAQVCKLHNEKYELYCREHDCPCCKKCVKSHNDFADNVKRLSANRKENLNSLKDKKREIEAEIKQTRTKINHHLDKLQDYLIKELMTVEQKEINKIEKLLTSLKKKEKEITEIQQNLASIKQHASELQIFLTMKDIEKDIAVGENFIQSITASDIINQVNVSCQINKSLQQISASVQKFGEIHVSYDSCDFTIQKRKNRQAQIMVALPARNIDNLTLTLHKRINTGLPYIRGCSMLTGDRTVFSSEEHKIRVFNSDGSKDFEISKNGLAFDVVFIGDDYIAVTSGEGIKIRIIDLNKHKLKKSFTVNTSNYGVVYKDGHLIYCAREKGLKMISLNDNSITNVDNNNLPYYAYVTTFGDKLFYTNFGNDSVTCCDYHGNMIWTFSDTRVLSSPLGISVDNDGCVFVVGYDTQNVVVISPDGQRCRQLLSRDDGLKRPHVLHSDTSSNKLLVANAANDAFLYEVR
ncbi:unnamed protein product [Mytilus edulis]|uniref:B box-type domain-containing protein n=1 Tax=Mytilus edulis TaxID=6550 RepID=A0A8S3UZB1_MYTED|nr:unnamed protein product [Mytilus edulis]